MSLEYKNIDVGDRIKISPSGFSNLQGNRGAWYKNNILKSGEFRGNTNTVVGTIIHGRIENYFNGVPTNTEEEQSYIESHSEVPEVDAWKVDEDVERLWELLKLELPTWEKPDKQEQEVRLDIPNSNYTIAGTYDYLKGTILGDLKTSSSAPKKIKVSHCIQLALYTLCCRAMGTQITHWEVTYIVKTKTPKIVKHLVEVDEEFVEQTKKEVKGLIVALDLVKANPELADAIFPVNRDSFLS